MQSSLELWFDSEERPYTGKELRPHFLLSQFKKEGDSIVAFVGACHVETDHLVDWEDRLENETIVAKKMIHFLGEFFGENLKATILLQRLIISEVESLLAQQFEVEPARMNRIGNDLYIDKRKLNVSIVTASPLSTLMHIGINLDASGAPVPAIGLLDLAGIGPQMGPGVERFISLLFERIKTQWEGVRWACVKVRPVV